ncbi:MAG: hypothetical protein ACI84D_002372, partial [Thalassolituus oleivorans]
MHESASGPAAKIRAIIGHGMEGAFWGFILFCKRF